MRICTEVDDELGQELYDLVPWGLRAQIMRIALRMVIDLIKKHGLAAGGALIEGHVRLTVDLPDKETPCPD